MKPTDFEPLYSHTFAAMKAAGLVDVEGFPSLAELTQTIKDTVGDEQLSFDDFEQFFAWWDVTTAYDQLDEEASAEHHKPALEVAFAALVREGFFAVDFKKNYEAKEAELIKSGAVALGELPTFETATEEIRLAVGIEQIRFWSFEEFFEFYEQSVAIAAQNCSLTLEQEKPALEVLYWALVCEGVL